MKYRIHFVFYFAFCLNYFLYSQNIEIKNSQIVIKSGHREIVTFSTKKPFVEAVKNIPHFKMHLGSFTHRRKTVARKEFYYHELQKKSNYIDILLKTKDKADSLILRISEQKEPYQFNIKIVAVPAYNEYSIAFLNEPNEVFWGGGEQFSHFVLNGRNIPFWVEEQGIGRGDFPISWLTNFKKADGNHHTTFAPIPWIMSSKKRSFGAKEYRWTAIDFRHQDRTILRMSDSLNMFFSVFDKMEQMVGASHKKVKPLPDWTFGTIVGLQGGTDTVLQRIKVLEAAGLCPSAVWIQDWCGRRVTKFGKQLKWNWELDTNRYPHFEAFVDTLHHKNIKILAYVNPFFAADMPLAAEAVQKGYVIRHTNGEPYKIKATGFDVFLLDVYEPKAVEWLKAILQKNLIANGFDGWMADFGEWMPTDVWQQDRERPHNLYPVLWAKLNSELIDKTGRTDIAFFSRSWFSGEALSHQFFWAGDQNTNWKRHDGLPSVIPALLSSGISGMYVNHSDVGGFTSFKKSILSMKRSRKLLCRWIELGAFSPVFRTHESLNPTINLQVYDDRKITEFYKRFSAIRQTLLPYLLSVHKEPLPMVRPLWLHFGEDKNTYHLDKEFLLGQKILVIPTLKKTNKVRAYFPEGVWTHYFTHQKISSKGEWRTIRTPLGQPAVFQYD